MALSVSRTAGNGKGMALSLSALSLDEKVISALAAADQMGALLAISMDALPNELLQHILGQLWNPLEPSSAVYFSSASSGLRLLLTPALLQQLRADHEAAAALCHKVGMQSCKELREARIASILGKGLSAAGRGLWLLLTPALRQRFRTDHEVAAALCRKMGLRSCKELREAKQIRWEDTGLTAADLTTLSMLFSVLPALQVLAIREFQALNSGAAGTDSVQRLAEGLRSGALPAVRILGFGYMHVGDAGASALAAALDRGALPRLMCLGLISTAIGDAGLVALAPALRRLPALVELCFSANPFGDEGIAALVAPPPPAGALPPPTGGLKKLQMLILDRTQVSDAGCATLATALDSGALPALENLVVCGIPASAVALARVYAKVGRRRSLPVP